MTTYSSILIIDSRKERFPWKIVCFAKLQRGDIPSKKLYEDEQVVAFYDIAPQAKVHFLVIPKSTSPRPLR